MIRFKIHKYLVVAIHVVGVSGDEQSWKDGAPVCLVTEDGSEALVLVLHV